MAYWLLKSEPEEYSWERMVADGKTRWEGVRNNQAALHLKAMAAGDRAFFYHSGAERRIVGIVEVSRAHYPDPTDEKGRFVAVDVRAVGPVARPVTLAEIKAAPRLAHLPLLKMSRLSVSSIGPKDWTLLCSMAKTKP